VGDDQVTEHGLGLAVVSYHSLPDLTAFCESLVDARPQIYISLNIVCVETTPDERTVVDQLATDLQGVVDVVSTTYHPDNCGYARSCNAAAVAFLKDPHIDTVAFFNADTKLRSGVLERVVEVMWSDGSYAIAGPRQIDTEGKITHAGIFNGLASPQHRGWHEPAGNKYQDVRDDATFVSGSAYFVKAPVWSMLSECPHYRAVDPASEGAMLTTHLYYEESWVSAHAHSHGLRVVYVGDATMEHRWHGAIGPAGLDGTNLFRESKAKFVHACESHDPAIDHD
jgi:GT2 family glycosyltransferase